MAHRQVLIGALLMSGSLACIPPPCESQAVEITVVHGGSADQRSTLTYVPDLILREDRLFVIDEGNRQVLVLDDGGEVIAKWGREGDGPGEYRMPYRLGFLSDTVWIVDRGNMRLTLLDLAGHVVETLRLRSPRIGNNLQPAAPSALLQGGRFIASPGYLLVEGIEREVPYAPLLMVSRDQAGVDTLGLYPTAGRYWRTGDPRDSGGVSGVLSKGNPFGPRPIWDATSDGRFAAWAEIDPEARSIEITVLDVVSGARRHLGIPFAPGAVSQWQIDQAVDDRVRLMQQFPQFQTTPSGRLRQWARESLPLPEYDLPVSALVVADGGNVVWLRRQPTPDRRYPWEAYDLSGILLNQILLPIDLQVREATADALWGVLPDDLDVAQVVRVSFR